MLQGDGTYKFYYFDGTFFSLGSTTDGTGGQKLSYDEILKSTKTNNFLVTVTGNNSNRKCRECCNIHRVYNPPGQLI